MQGCVCKRIHHRALGHAALSSQNKPQLLLHNKSFLSMSWGQLRHPLVHFSIIQLHSINTAPSALTVGDLGLQEVMALTLSLWRHLKRNEQTTSFCDNWLTLWSGGSISSILFFSCVQHVHQRETDRDRPDGKEKERGLCYYVAVTDSDAVSPPSW